MKKACIVVSSYYHKNKLFDLADLSVNRDNCLYSFSALKQKLKQLGYDIATDDINSIYESELVLYNDMPKVLPPPDHYHKSYLLLFETELIRPDNWNLEYHKCFRKIFTWNDSVIDNLRYFKMNFSHLIPDALPEVSFQSKRLCTLIAGNKFVKHPKELYSKRREAIDWFAQNNPQDLDLYGLGWNEHLTKYKFLNKFFKKINLASFVPAKTPLCFKGSVQNKNEVMQKYKFSICYENAFEIPGYITEKIFDSFFAGCVPIYWGASNIADFIPSSCYVERLKFATYGDLYRFMKQMPEYEYSKYIEAIKAFLKSDRVKQFDANNFADVITKNVLS